MIYVDHAWMQTIHDQIIIYSSACVQQYTPAYTQKKEEEKKPTPHHGRAFIVDSYTAKMAALTTNARDRDAGMPRTRARGPSCATV